MGPTIITNLSEITFKQKQHACKENSIEIIKGVRPSPFDPKYPEGQQNENRQI